MKKIVISLGFLLINVLGDALIFIARIINILHGLLTASLFFIIVLAICLITIIALFDLFTKPELMNVFGKWYWDVLILMIGGSTIMFLLNKINE